MKQTDKKIHTTINLSARLIKDAQRLFKNKTKTEIIHDALKRMIKIEKLDRHFSQWKGRASIKNYG